MSLAALIGIDKERYDQGNKFLSQDPYLQNFQARAPITFNVSSPANTGIMGPRIYPYPIIPQEGGDGGGGGITPRGNSKFDYEFEALGGLNNPDNVALTEEEQDILDAQKNKDRLSMAAQLGLFALNPMGYVMGKGINKAVGFVKDKFFDDDGDGGGDGPGPDINPGTFTKESIDQSFAGEEGPTGGGESTGTMSASDFSDDTAGTPFEYGGRVGFSNGGLSTYEISTLKGLGYDTKGGTVLEPFGGVKVLRDILKVNKMAEGGIVGLYR